MLSLGFTVLEEISTTIIIVVVVTITLQDNVDEKYLVAFISLYYWCCNDSVYCSFLLKEVNSYNNISYSNFTLMLDLSAAYMELYLKSFALTSQDYFLNIVH